MARERVFNPNGTITYRSTGSEHYEMFEYEWCSKPMLTKEEKKQMKLPKSMRNGW